jgi:hypothetical protein
MKRSTPLFAAALALLAGAGAARADLIEWSYNWDRTPVSVTSDSGNGSVSFTNEPTKHATGSSDTVATNLKANSLAAVDKPDTISGSNGNYALTLKLTDKASGQSGTLTFTGKLSGSFSKDSANITNVFNGPLTQVLTLGVNTYTVTMGQYAPPGPPSASNFGSIAAHVDVQGSVVGAKNTPEPSTLVLSGLGLGLALAGAGWRKRRALALA